MDGRTRFPSQPALIAAGFGRGLCLAQVLKLWNPHSNHLPWVPLLPLLTVWGGALLSEFELVSLERAYIWGPLYAWLCDGPKGPWRLLVNKGTSVQTPDR